MLLRAMEIRGKQAFESGLGKLAGGIKAFNRNGTSQVRLTGGGLRRGNLGRRRRYPASWWRPLASPTSGRQSKRKSQRPRPPRRTTRPDPTDPITQAPYKFTNEAMHADTSMRSPCGGEREKKLDGMMEWVRGATVGRGSFATVSLAVVKDGGDSQLPKLMAVKSASLSRSSSLQHEESILTRLQHCPHVIRCFGHDLADASEQTYNLFLEYASGGALSDVVRRAGGSLPEPMVRRFTRSILEGLRSIHAEGYVHCDIKLQNILVQGDGDVRIADFGLAKKTGDEVDDCPRLRGTPVYMSPESVARNEYEARADIWSLGCAVAEMASGRPAWRSSEEGDVWALLLRIGFGDELPEIPGELSEEGKDFLRRCFAKDPKKRWTAEVLLGHPFVADSRSFEDDGADAALLPFVSGSAGVECRTPVRTSPKSVLDFLQWMSPAYPSPSTCSAALQGSLTASRGCRHASPAERISDLATGQQPPDWSCNSSVGSWIDVRQGGFVYRSEVETRTVECDSKLILEEVVATERGEKKRWKVTSEAFER